MALQGTLDTFALADVLRLLASTRKTGRFHLTGGRGNGSVFVDGGSVVATESSSGRTGAPAVEVMFELLRFSEGSFIFEADRTAPEPGAPLDVEPLLADAEHMLQEWRQIEAVVPSMDSWVTLAPELRGEVVVGPATWRTVAAIGGGVPVWSIGEALGLGEVAVSRSVKDLVDLGLARVQEPGALEDAPDASDRPVYEAFRPFDAADEEDDEEDEPVVTASAPPPVFADTPPDEAEEIARQIASLSPRAARAVAAAARAETEEEREAALAEVPDDEEPINRGLLLKFLSSVRT